ncbi:VOC family protein [Corynebacterium canis]|uniref:VOC family protein n=1 Tax=Corynebacterium canis TaxID=679663 RepID=A0A5C5TRR8_9CORY|nr:VOC family protein [Corynebacterium canis]TWT17001.1 VOC family protein [Corynebacterium canis]WJY73927.1 27 kDa antigen Cfp30B [Corynebacterium canis]
MPAFMAEGGMPYWIDLITSDVRRAAHFYNQLLDWEFEETAPGYRLARVQGLPVAAIVEKPSEEQLPDTWVTHFLADNLDAEVEKASELGARVLTEPSEISFGRMAVLVDPSGALFGLIEPASEEAFIAAGEPGTPVWHELTCTAAYDAACKFYRGLFGWTTHEMDGFPYTTALVDGSPFAGIWNAQPNFPPKMPSFWQTFLGVADVEEVVAKVGELGGKVIREPWDSEFGHMVIIADSTGATVTLAKVDPPVEEAHESDPLEGIDLSQFGV